MMEYVSHLLIEPIVSHVPCEPVLHLQAIGTPWNTKVSKFCLFRLRRCVAARHMLAFTDITLR